MPEQAADLHEPADPLAKGMLNRPLFEPTPEIIPGGKWPKTKRVRNKWAPLLDVVREHPGQDAMIAEYTKGGKKKTLLDARNAKRQIETYLVHYCPLERWKVNIRSRPDKWAERTVRVTYIGTFTAAEQAIYRGQVRREWELRIGKAREKRAEAEKAARQAAIQQTRGQAR